MSSNQNAIFQLLDLSKDLKIKYQTINKSILSIKKNKQKKKFVIYCIDRLIKLHWYRLAHTCHDYLLLPKIDQ